MNAGSIVRCRNRDWVLLPSDRSDLFLLRPLAASSDEVVAVHRQLADLIGAELPEEKVRPSMFPLPSVDDVSDVASAHLLWQAARLTLREGATPLRSLGRVSIRPRVYQFVPLLMALRLDPVQTRNLTREELADLTNPDPTIRNAMRDQLYQGKMPRKLAELSEAERLRDAQFGERYKKLLLAMLDEEEYVYRYTTR